MSDSSNPLARVLLAVINAQEQEGTRIARLLHDEVGQVMSAVGLHLDVLRMDLQAKAPEAAERIGETQKILEQAVEQVRSLSYELNPEVVERAGLATALARLVGRFRDLTDRPVRLLHDSSIQLPVKAAASMYKIAEAALDNAIVHSDSDQVEVFVRASKKGPVLEVRDDGCGFDVEAAATDPPGLGLLLMGCYAEQGGLEFEVTSKPGEGTIVRSRYAEPGSE